MSGCTCGHAHIDPVLAAEMVRLQEEAAEGRSWRLIAKDLRAEVDRLYALYGGLE